MGTIFGLIDQEARTTFHPPALTRTNARTEIVHLRSACIMQSLPRL